MDVVLTHKIIEKQYILDPLNNERTMTNMKSNHWPSMHIETMSRNGSAGDKQQVYRMREFETWRSEESKLRQTYMTAITTNL